MSDAPSSPIAPPPIVALAGWLVPGLGHVFAGERVRGIIIGVTIILMYVSGLLIGGLRVVEVPGYDMFGRPIKNSSLLNEVRSKPWSIAQVMAGPLGVASGAASLWASGSNGSGGTIGYASHARVNEIGTLYTAVAGMLNLLAILDATGRAGRKAGQ